MIDLAQFTLHSATIKIGVIPIRSDETGEFTLHSATIKINTFTKTNNFKDIFTLHSATIKMILIKIYYKAIK